MLSDRSLVSATQSGSRSGDGSPCTRAAVWWLNVRVGNRRAAAAASTPPNAATESSTCFMARIPGSAGVPGSRSSGSASVFTQPPSRIPFQLA